MYTAPELAVVVVAAGRGSRAGGRIPKQYKNLAGRPLLAHTLSALIRAAPGATILPVIHSNHLDLYQSGSASFEASAGLAQPVFGGTTRQASVRLGLEALAGQQSRPNIVLIHDAARPFVSDALINRAVAAAITTGAAVPAVTLAETIKEIDADSNVAATLPRARLRAVQTPQAFRFDLILDAHRNAAARGILELTDDAAVAEWAGHR
ncbi:MAG: IspD/TarI family cytidylyltransferase, partial [Methylocella sp.]